MLRRNLANPDTISGTVNQFFDGCNHRTAVAAEKQIRRWLQEDGPTSRDERCLWARDVVALAERELPR